MQSPQHKKLIKVNTLPFQFDKKICTQKLGSGAYGVTFECYDSDAAENEKEREPLAIKLSLDVCDRPLTSVCCREMTLMALANEFDDYPCLVNYKDFKCYTETLYVDKDLDNPKYIQYAYTMEKIPKSFGKVLIEYAAQYLYEILKIEYPESYEDIFANAANLNEIIGFLKSNNYCYSKRFETRAYVRYLYWVQSLLRCMLIAFSKLESNKICYRDFKEDNFLFDKYNDFVLVDFGLARMEEQAPGTENFAIGVTNVSYADPVTVVGAKANKTKNDLWSIAILIIKILNFPLEKIAALLLETVYVKKTLGRAILTVIEINIDNFLANVTNIFKYVKLVDLLAAFVDTQYLDYVVLKSDRVKETNPRWADCQLTNEEVNRIKTQRNNFIQIFIEKGGIRSREAMVRAKCFQETGIPDISIRATQESRKTRLYSDLVTAVNKCLSLHLNEHYLDTIFKLCGIDGDDLQMFRSIIENFFKDPTSYSTRNGTEDILKNIHSRLSADYLMRRENVKLAASQYKEENLKEICLALKAPAQNTATAQSFEKFREILGKVLVYNIENRPTARSILIDNSAWFNEVPLSDGILNKIFKYMKKEFESDQQVEVSPLQRALNIIKKNVWLSTCDIKQALNYFGIRDDQ